MTPTAILPARELLVDLLLELDRPAEAMTEYQRSPDAEPKRFRSLLGAARASERLEASARAREF